jgi:hypothetical protein
MTGKKALDAIGVVVTLTCLCSAYQLWGGWGIVWTTSCGAWLALGIVRTVKGG